MRATAASTGTEGWHTAMMCVSPPSRNWHHTCVDPLGDVDVVVGQEALDRAAQQRRVMPRHRRDDEQARLRTARQVLEGALEMQQAAERPLPRDGDVHRHALAAHHGGGNVPFRLAVTPRRALEQFQARGHGLAESGIGKRVGWVPVEQPCGVGDGTRWIEQCLAHFIEPIRRRPEHRDGIARRGRRAAEFTNCHFPGL
jgi:hypothetical protein